MKRNKRKQNKFLRSTITLALTAILGLGGTMTALAAPSPSTGTEASPAEAKITKNLEMADGTVTPAGNFTFVFTKVSEDGAAPTAAMPAIPGRTVTIAAGATGSSSGGITTVTGDTINILDSITFPHAGIYEYTVDETDNSASYPSPETMTCSQAEYTVKVYVENGITNPNSTFVKHIEVVKTKGDDGTAISTGGKIDLGGGAATNEFVFVNTYSKTSGGTTNPAADSALKFGKTVTGAMGDKTKYFAFELTMQKAAMDVGTPTYKLYLFENGTIQTTIPTDVYSGTIQNDTTYDYIEATAGTPINVNLKHGQELSVLSAMVGTTYRVKESGVADYTPGVAVTTNGGTPVNTPGTSGVDLTTPGVGGSNYELISAGANSAAFTNAYKTVTPPTGFAVDSLPFVILIGLVTGAFVVVGMIKSRKKHYASK